MMGLGGPIAPQLLSERGPLLEKGGVLGSGWDAEGRQNGGTVGGAAGALEGGQEDDREEESEGGEER